MYVSIETLTGINTCSKMFSPPPLSSIATTPRMYCVAVVQSKQRLLLGLIDTS